MQSNYTLASVHMLIADIIISIVGAAVAQLVERAAN